MKCTANAPNDKGKGIRVPPTLVFSAGMWSDGEGELQVSSSTVFLPQEPYLPEGSLRPGFI